MREIFDGPIFQATFFSTAWAGGELLTMLTTRASRLRVLNVDIQQYSTAPQAMTVEMWRGSSSTGGGGAAVPVTERGGESTRAPTATLLSTPAALSSTAGAARLFAGGVNPTYGQFSWMPDEPPTVKLDSHFSIRTSTLAAGVAPIGVTIGFQEYGRMPSS